MKWRHREALRALPDNAVADSGPRTRLGLLALCGAVLLIPATAWCIHAAKGHYSGQGAWWGAGVLILLTGLVLRWTWRRLRWRPPFTGTVDVLRGVLGFYIPSNTCDVAVACFCRPDETAPCEDSAVLVFLQNHALRSRHVTVRIGFPTRLPGQSSMQVTLFVGPGQVTVYRLPFHIPDLGSNERLEFRCGIRVKAPDGDGELFDTRALGVPFFNWRSRRRIRPFVLVKYPPREHGAGLPTSTDAAITQTAPMKSADYLSLYSRISGRICG